MSERPKRSAVTKREGTDKLLDNRRRRSSAQVQQDKQIAATTAAASEGKKIDLAFQKKKQVAAFEDQLRKEDQQRDKNMARPDLVAAHHPRKPTPKQRSLPVKASTNVTTVTDTLILEQTEIKSPDQEYEDHEIEHKRPVLDPDFSFADDGPAEQDYTLSEGPKDIPDGSVVGTSSSGGQGLGFEDLSDGDHENDEDYIMGLDDGDKGSNSDSDGDIYVREVQEHPKKPEKIKSAKKEEKPKRGDFRKAIYNVRNNSAIPGNTAILGSTTVKSKPPTAQKRKGPDTSNKPSGSVVEKRAKKSEGGLLSGWANKAAKQRLDIISARNASSREALEDKEDPLEYAGGEFDEDEPIKLVRATRDLKNPAISIRGKQETTVKIIEPIITASEVSSGSRRVRKIRYTLSSLPFPRGAASTSYIRDWRKIFKPTLIHWAATLEDPFGTNAVIDAIVSEVWKMVFPSIANEVDGDNREAIISVAGDALIDWRSAMGKEGLRLVLKAFNEDEVTKEDARQAAEYYLENYRFLYANPDDNTGNKGAFLSPLVSTCLAVHLKKTVNNAIQCGYPVGGLAIATAVLERGLDLIKAGHVGLDGREIDLVNDEASACKKRKTNHYAGYTDAVWGGKTRGWAASASRLDDVKWKDILHAAVDNMDLSAEDGDVEDGGGELDPRSLIEIW